MTQIFFNRRFDRFKWIYTDFFFLLLLMELHADDTDQADETDFLSLLMKFHTDGTDIFLTADSADLNRFIQISFSSDC